MMRKMIALAASLLLLTGLLAGCDSPPQNNPAGTPTPGGGRDTTSSAPDIMPDLNGLPEDVQNAINDSLDKVNAGDFTLPENWDSMTTEEQADWAMSLFLGGGAWPEDSLPADMPVFNDCTVVAAGGAPEDFIIKAEADGSAAEAYFSELEAAGYEVTRSGDECTAVKGGVTIEIVKQSDVLYQISVRVMGAGEWPAGMPDFITPPEGKQLLEGAFYDDNSGDGTMFYGGFTVDGMTEAEAEAYLSELATTLTDGAYGGWELYGTAESDGKLWGVQLSIYEAEGGRVQFIVNVWVSE